MSVVLFLSDIVDFLYEKVLPGMVKDCEDLDDNELKVDQKQSFLLSDIFKDIEDHCDDSDEESGQKEDDNSSWTIITCQSDLNDFCKNHIKYTTTKEKYIVEMYM